MKTEQIHSYTSEGEPLILAQPVNELLHDKHQEILALRQQLEKCEKRAIKNSKQRQRWKKRAEQAKRERDEQEALLTELQANYEELKRKNHCQSEQLNQYATENDELKRRADELAAHVELLSGALTRICDAQTMEDAENEMRPVYDLLKQPPPNP